MTKYFKEANGFEMNKTIMEWFVLFYVVCQDGIRLIKRIYLWQAV